MQLKVKVVCSGIHDSSPPLVQLLLVLVLVCLWAVVRVEGCSRSPPPGTDCSTAVECHLREEGSGGSGVTLLPLEDPQDK